MESRCEPAGHQGVEGGLLSRLSFFDDRLWMRLGLQQIVWGKTELFRTTDQFNPQDLGLSTLPSLEESRIATNSARFIYSLYDVGPLQDVRLEFAVNFDKVEPADLGHLRRALRSRQRGLRHLGCGLHPRVPRASESPARIDLRTRGTIRTGSNSEAAIEWRWDRFSFALTDFYGYDDFPTFVGVHDFRASLRHRDGPPSRHAIQSRKPEGRLCDRSCNGFAGSELRDRPRHRKRIRIVSGSGTPLTNPKFVENMPERYSAMASDKNALEWHSANQQAFAWLCSATIGITPELDMESVCGEFVSTARSAWAGFPSHSRLAEVSSSMFAGEYRFNQFLRGHSADHRENRTGWTDTHAIAQPRRQRRFHHVDSGIGPRLRRFVGYGRGGKPGLQRSHVRTGLINRGPIGGNVLAKQLPTREDYFTLDSGLTNEQRALLGCGPFFGTRCDSSVTFEINDCDPLTCSRDGCTVFEASRFARSSTTSSRGPHSPAVASICLNMEASAIMQSFPGFDGTPKGYITTSRAQAPGTINFDGGPVCTRYVPGQARPVKLPGCRGIDSYEITSTQVVFTFEKDYDPSVDGCLLAPTIATHAVVTLDSEGNDITNSDRDAKSCFGQLAPSTGDFDPSGPAPSTVRPCDDFVDDAACRAEIAEYLDKRNSDSLRGDYTETGSNVFFQHASTLYHPTAGCLSDAEIALQQELSPEDGPQLQHLRSERVWGFGRPRLRCGIPRGYCPDLPERTRRRLVELSRWVWW